MKLSLAAAALGAVFVMATGNEARADQCRSADLCGIVPVMRTVFAPANKDAMISRGELRQQTSSHDGRRVKVAQKRAR